MDNLSLENAAPTTIRLKPNRTRFVLLIGFGITLAAVVAYFVAIGQWFIAVGLLALFPTAVLLFAHPFTGVLLWLVIMPFASVLPSSNLVYWAVYRILPLMVLLMALISRALKVRDHPLVRLGPAELAMIILGLAVPASILFFQPDPGLALIRFGDRMLLPFCMYLIIRLLAPREREITWLVWVVLFMALSQSLIGFLSWYAPQRLPEIWHYLQGARTTGSVKDPDLYAAILAFSGALLIHAAIERKADVIRIGFFLTVGLCAIFGFLSLERAAWLGGIFVAFGLLFLYPKMMLRLGMIGAIVVVILGTGILSTHFALSLNRLNESDPVYDRLVVFDAMFQMIQIKPALGWGYETLDNNIQHYYRRVGGASILRRMVTSHNTYLTVLTELGMVGFTLYMFPVVWWLILSFRVWKRMPKTGLLSRALLAVFWLVLLFQFTVSNFFDMRWFEIGLTLWWLTLGFIANMVYPYLRGTTVLLRAGNEEIYES